MTNNEGIFDVLGFGYDGELFYTTPQMLPSCRLSSLEAALADTIQMITHHSPIHGDMPVTKMVIREWVGPSPEKGEWKNRREVIRIAKKPGYRITEV